jgi:hypothetical protein
MATDLRPEGISPAPPSSRDRPSLHGRLAVAARVGLAALGGYAVAALATAFGAVALPLPRAEAVTAATLASFAVMAGAVVFVFATATLARAALGLAGCAALLAMGLWLAGGFSATGPA